MKNVICFIALILLIDFNAHAQPDFGWANAYGQDDFYEQFTSLVLDQDNNIYVVGRTDWDTDLNPMGDVTSHMGFSGSTWFLAKYNSVGNLVWVNHLQYEYYGNPAMNLSADNELVVIQNCDLDSTRFTRYDTSGVIIFDKMIFLDGVLTAGPLDTDHQNSVYLTVTTGNADLDPGPEVVLPGSSTIYKLDSLANFIWVKTFYGFAMTIKDLEVSDDLIYCVGKFYTDIDFDPGSDQHILIAQDDTWDNWYSDSYVLCLDTAGEFNWVKQFANLSEDGAFSLDVDEDQNLFVAGVFNDIIDFDPASAEGLYDVTERAFYTCKLNSSGDIQWVKLIEHNGFSYISSISLDDVGDVYLHGTFTGNLYDFAQISPIVLSSSSTATSGFLLKLDEHGNYKWSQKFNGEFIEAVEASHCAVDHNGDVVAVGGFSGSVDFDGGSSDFILSGDLDMYMVKLIQGPLGLTAEESIKDQLSIYPNPGNGLVSLTTASDGLLEIYAISGELISTQSLNAGTTQLDFTKFANGIYLIVLSNSTSSQSIRYVKQ